MFFFQNHTCTCSLFADITATRNKYIVELPTNKVALKSLRFELFTVFNSKYFPYGHALTNYDRWFNATKPYAVKWTPSCYEPYVLIKTKYFPSFDERFVGYGFNKLQHTFRLAAEGFRFVVLPHDFVIHIPHEIYVFENDDPRRQICLHKVMANFFKDLSNNYGCRVKNYALAIANYLRKQAVPRSFTRLFCATLQTFH